MKISTFVHDLAANPIGRMHPLLRAIEQGGHTTEVMGFLISGDDVYLPYRGKHDCRTIRSTGSVLSVFRDAWKLSRLATGDVIYAGKPLLTSLFPALLASGFGRRKPLFLDVEDDDVWAPDGSDSFSGFINFYIRGFKRATCCKWGLVLHPFTRTAKAITVSSRKLQKRYGGTIVRHGPDESIFDPSLPALDRALARAHYRIPEGGLVIAFAGTPHRHKGFDDLLAAVAQCHHEFRLLLCGDPEHPLFQQARLMFPGRCIFTGFLPNDDMPRFLSAGDIVPILQRDTRYSQAQLPAKLLEAMAMAKLVVATRVGDLPEILGEGTAHPRGWVISPEDSAALSRVLDEIAGLAEEARQARASAARQWYLEHASVRANAEILGRVLGPETGKRRPER